MQKGIVFSFFFLFSSMLSAQLMVGLKASYSHTFVGTSTQLYDNNQNFVIYRLELNRQQVFPSIGGVAYYEFTNGFVNRNLSAHLQMEALFTYRRTHFTFENYITDADPKLANYAKGVSFLRLPIVGGLEYKSLKFSFGPIFSFMLHEEKVFGLYPNIDEQYRRFEPAASALLGYRVDDFIIDLSYEYHFNGVSEFIFYKERISGFKEQPHYLAINATYLFKTRY